MINAIQDVRYPVLLIDDDEIIAGSLRRYLTMEGYRVDVAVDTRLAIALMRASSYGAIVVDPYMTGAVPDEGNRLLRAIRTLQPSASTIVLTGYSSPELTRLATECRASTVLAKPQSVVVLSELIFGALRDAPDR